LPLWVERVGGRLYDRAYDVAVDSDGNAIVVGYVDYDQTEHGSRKLFVTKRSGADGREIWTRRYGGAGYAQACRVALSPRGEIAVTGFWRGTIDFGRGAVTSSELSTFVALYSGKDGTLKWVTSFGSAAGDYSFGIAVDASGDVVATSTLQGELTLGAQSLRSLGDPDILVAKFAAGDGAPRWAGQIGGKKFDVGNSVQIGSGNQIYLAGMVVGPVQMMDRQVSGGADLFVVVLDPSGKVVRGLRSSASRIAGGADLSVIGDGDVVVGGVFAIAMEIAGTRLTGNADFDGVLARLWLRP
jgi:hypothetical protein